MNITISLDLLERKWLLNLAKVYKGRISYFDFDKVSVKAGDMIKGLQKKGAINITDLIGSHLKQINLTDIGANLCEMLEKGQIIT